MSVPPCKYACIYHTACTLCYYVDLLWLGECDLVVWRTWYTLHPWHLGPTSSSVTWLELSLIYLILLGVVDPSLQLFPVDIWLAHGLREPHSRSRQDGSCYKDGMHRLVVTLHFTVLPRALGVTAGAPVSLMDIALKTPKSETGCWLMMSVPVHVYSFDRLSLVLLFDLQMCYNICGVDSLWRVQR